MKICHAFIFYSVRFAGGTSDLMTKLCRTQVRQGLQPYVYSGDYRFDGELAASCPGVTFRVVRSYLDAQGFSLMPALIPLARRELREFSVVHMHAFRTFQNAVLYWFCRRYDIPYIIDAHGAVPYYKRKQLIKRVFDRLVGCRMLRGAAALVAETEVGVREYLDIDPTLPRSKILVLSPPFDTSEFAVLPVRGGFRQKFGIDDAEKVIMFLGRVHHIKGNDFLIEGFAEYLRRGGSARLVIVGGDDGHMEACKTLAKNIGVADKVLFTGFLAGEEKLSALVDADVVAQMSRQEQGAWAPFEAVLCGTPILVSSHTGAGEDVRRIDAGYLVEFGNASDLADRIAFVFARYDEAKVKTAHAKGTIMASMSMEARAHEYIELYDKAIAGRRALAR